MTVTKVANGDKTINLLDLSGNGPSSADPYLNRTVPVIMMPGESLLINYQKDSNSRQGVDNCYFYLRSFMSTLPGSGNIGADNLTVDGRINNLQLDLLQDYYEAPTDAVLNDWITSGSYVKYMEFTEDFAVDAMATTTAASPATQPLTVAPFTLTLASNARFPTAGTISVMTQTGFQTVTYTGLSGTTQLTGCVATGSFTADALSSVTLVVSPGIAPVAGSSVYGIGGSSTTVVGDNGSFPSPNGGLINVLSAASLPASGIVNVATSTGSFNAYYTGKASAATTIAAGSDGLALPQAIVNVASTVGFNPTGTIVVATSAGSQTVTYTGTTATTFTGCAGGTGNMTTGGAVSQNTLSFYSTSIAAASNSAILPQSTIFVATTTGFAASGSVEIMTASGTQTVAYTGIAGNSFTGCTGGTGALATGNAVYVLGTGPTMGVTGSNGTITTGGAVIDQTLVPNGGAARTYNNLTSFPIRYHGTDQNLLTYNKFADSAAQMKHTVSYFHQRGFPLPQPDITSSYSDLNDVYIGLARQGQRTSPTQNYVAIKFVYNLRTGRNFSYIPTHIDLVATATKRWGSILGVYQPDVTKYKNGYRYPVRIPVTTDIGEFKRSSMCCYYNYNKATITIKVNRPEGLFLGSEIINPTFNTLLGPYNSYYYADKLTKFEGSFRLVRRDQKGTGIVSAGFNQSSNYTKMYNVGTILQSGTTVTGIGTQFNLAMVGGFFTGGNGRRYTITAFVNSTTIRVSGSFISGGSPPIPEPYAIYYGFTTKPEALVQCSSKITVSTILTRNVATNTVSPTYDTPVTTTTYLSFGAGPSVDLPIAANTKLPQSTIYASGSISNQNSGQIFVETDEGYNAKITYAGVISANTTISAASAGFQLPQAVINVSSTAQFPDASPTNPQVMSIVAVDQYGNSVQTGVTYTGKMATQFTGCTGGAGIITTGAAVLRNSYEGCIGGSGTLISGGQIRDANNTISTTFGGIICPILSGVNSAFDVYNYPGALNAFAVSEDPIHQQPSGSFLEGDNSITRIVEKSSVPSVMNMFDNPSWATVARTFATNAYQIMSGDVAITYPENNSSLPATIPIPTADAMGGVMIHEMVHNTQFAGGYLGWVDTESAAVGIEMDPLASKNSFVLFRSRVYYQQARRLSRGLINPMMMHIYGPYGQGHFWRYVATQFDKNYQAMRRMGEILVSETLGPMAAAAGYPDNAANYIALNYVGTAYAFDKALTQLFGRTYADVLTDFAISSTMFRNNTAIPAKWRHEYPFWLASTSYTAGYNHFLSYAGVYANWWDQMNTNAITADTSGTNIVGLSDSPSPQRENFYRTLTVTVTGSIAGNILTVSAGATGLYAGHIITGAGIAPGTIITGQVRITRSTADVVGNQYTIYHPTIASQTVPSTAITASSFTSDFPGSRLVHDMSYLIFEIAGAIEGTNININVTGGNWRFKVSQFTTDGTSLGTFVQSAPVSALPGAAGTLNINGSGSTSFNMGPFVSQPGKIYITAINTTLSAYNGLEAFFGMPVASGKVTITQV
jgi:hypothetical protein